MTHKDSIYAHPLEQVSDFVFDEKVVEVFPDMITRSVPGYSTMIQTAGQLGNRFARDHSLLYDLGSSLGATSIAMKQHIEAKHCRIIGYDNSPAMVERAQMHVNAWRGDTEVEIRCADILEVKLEPCSFVAMNFTLQFIEPEQRAQMIQTIYDALEPGGALFLSEKIRHDDEVADDIVIDLHHQFKRHNGYSDLEIAQKRAAIENIMRIDTADTHEQRLKQAGFTTVQNWYRCFNFISWFAIK